MLQLKKPHGNLSQVAKIANLCGDSLKIYSGNDDQILPILSLGGIGVISVLSNIMPEYTSNIVHSFFNGDINKSIKLQIDAIPLINALFCEVNPIPVKAGLNEMNFNVGIPRLPLVELTCLNKEKLFREMRKFNIL